jgi:hypothetical protein
MEQNVAATGADLQSSYNKWSGTPNKKSAAEMVRAEINQHETALTGGQRYSQSADPGQDDPQCNLRLHNALDFDNQHTKMANFFYNKTVALWRNKPYAQTTVSLCRYMAHARLSTIKDLTLSKACTLSA